MMKANVEEPCRQTFVWRGRTILVITFGFAAVCVLWGFGEISPVLGGGLALPPGYLAFRASRCALHLSPEGATSYGLFRTHRFRWSEVVEVYLGPGSSTGLPWMIPVFELREGIVKAQEVRSLREGGTPSKAVALANYYLKAERSDR